ncbi:hypothetical protein Lsan_0429 [Legionella santicrucis]|uniref:Uncharacterized protein n=1 Tax=Legionella santicrucis TaxID=45074 RepID=A0A0W0ZBI3_9GAMM|nr:hypothetical protein [Legionella santicrucis]KTD66484.1 hypothetical protein Lsan_0429 [Legionella santicrucis]
MSILNRVINWLYKEKIFEHYPEIKLEFLNNKTIDFVKYNPASGLPMVGGLDIGGNLYGTYRTDDYIRYQR